jgi:hypothetical protein
VFDYTTGLKTAEQFRGIGNKERVEDNMVTITKVFHRQRPIEG